MITFKKSELVCTKVLNCDTYKHYRKKEGVNWEYFLKNLVWKFTREGEMALAKMRMSITCGHLDSHSTNIDLIPSNQEFSNLMFKFW